MNLLFISIQGSYQTFELAIFKNNKIIASLDACPEKGSATLIPYLDTLLKQNNLSLNDISFVAVDQGPGAFTSLRVTITLANAIAFAKQIPLVGVDGLEAIAQETIEQTTKETFEQQPTLLISLLNAYNKEVYFAIHRIEHQKLTTAISKGYQKIDLLLKELLDNYSGDKILFTGNGVEMYRKEIEDTFQDLALFLKKPILASSAIYVGLLGLKQWNNKENIAEKLSPLYLKAQTFAIKK